MIDRHAMTALAIAGLDSNDDLVRMNQAARFSLRTNTHLGAELLQIADAGEFDCFGAARTLSQVYSQILNVRALGNAEASVRGRELAWLLSVAEYLQARLTEFGWRQYGGILDRDTLSPMTENTNADTDTTPEALQ